MIAATAPVFVTILAFIILREKIHWSDIICLCVATLGVFCVMRPPVVFGHPADKEVKEFPIRFWAGVAQIASTFCVAASSICTRQLKVIFQKVKEFLISYRYC